MQTKLICFSTIIFLLLSYSIYAQENFTRYELDNGMIVLIKENHSSPVVAVQICVKTGGSLEGDYAGSGLSHFVEHMLFKGTNKRKPSDIPNAIQEAGGTINAYTSNETTVYHTVVASQYFDIGLDVLSDAIMNSTFPQDEFEKEKDVILKEINMNEDDPTRFLYLLFWSTAYTTHPYKYPVIGYREIFSRLTRDELIKYYKERYVPNNMILVIAGDINTQEVLEKSKNIFKDFQRSTLKTPYIPIEPKQISMRQVQKEKDVNVTHVFMGYHGPSIFDKDLYAMDMLSMILGDGRSSRLFKELKEKKQLVYSVRAFSYTPNYPGIFGVGYSADKQNIEIIQKCILEEIEKIRKEGVTEEELKKASTQVLSDHIFGQQTVEGEASDILSDEAINSTNFSNKYLDEISKVTSKDLQNVIEKYIYNDNLTVVSIIPQQKLENKTQKTEEIKQKVEIKKAELSNGMKVIIKENHNIPIVSIKAVFLGGIRYENEKNNGIGVFMQTIIKKGTKSYSAEQINDIIESCGGSLEAYSADNSFGFTVNILKQDFDKGFLLLHSVITEPLFPEDEIEKERKNILMGIKTRDDNVFKSASLLFRKNMFTAHPYRFSTSGEEESIKSITKNDISEFYKSFCTPDNMVLAIYGDVSSDEVIKKLEEIFKDFKSNKKNSLEIPKEPMLESIKKVEKEKENITQSVIFLGFQGMDIKNDDRYVFEVISGLYSDMGGRLYNKIREEQGLAYYVGAYSMLGIDPGAYVFYTGTVADKVDITIEIILSEIKRLQNEPIPQEELIRIKKNLIGEKAISLQTNESQAFEDALNELYGLGYNYAYDYAEKINKVSAEDIQRVAKKYFTLDRYVLTVTKPKK